MTDIRGIAHRGYSRTAPENTLPAYRLAREKGFTFTETDVEWTSDGIPVLLHDGEINRTARNADGTAIAEPVGIGSITLEQARGYDFGSWKRPEYAGTRIPTFDEFVALCLELGFHPYIELKGSITAAQASTVYDIVKKYGMTGSVSWISFSLPSLQAISAIDPAARLGYLCCAMTDVEVAAAASLKTGHNEIFIDTIYTAVTAEPVKAAISKNIAVEIWTINNPEHVAPLVAMGVTGFTTDHLNIAEVIGL